MSDIDRIGVARAIEQALEHVPARAWYVSLDMDALDPEIAPGVGTPVKGGLSYREAHLAVELIAESGLAGSLEVVEVNPISTARTRPRSWPLSSSRRARGPDPLRLNR